jgi:UDP-glucose 4-epimerase
MMQHRVQVRLEERRSSGVPICSSNRASARETPDWVTGSTSLTSVTVVPSATC